MPKEKTKSGFKRKIRYAREELSQVKEIINPLFTKGCFNFKQCINLESTAYSFPTQLEKCKSITQEFLQFLAKDDADLSTTEDAIYEYMQKANELYHKSIAKVANQKM